MAFFVFFLSLPVENMGIGAFCGFRFRYIHDPPCVHDRATDFGVLRIAYKVLLLAILCVYPAIEQGFGSMYSFSFSDTTDFPHPQDVATGA